MRNQTKENILIIGASGHSKMIIDIILKNDNYHIVGLIDTHKPIGEIVFGFPILGREQDISGIVKKHGIKGFVIGIGDNWTRKKVSDLLKEKLPELVFFPIIHPSAILAEGIKITNGTVVMAGAIINADAKIGECCIINTNSSLGHDSVMQDFSSLASGVTIGGNVNIGYCSAISLGASVIQNITIGKHTVIGAGASVLNNIGDFKIAFGVPAKQYRSREIDDAYLKRNKI